VVDRGGDLVSGIRRVTANEGRMQSKQNISLDGHFPLAALFHARSLPVAVTLLTAEDVAADSLVEHAETVSHEVADVGQIEKSQRNAEQRVDDRYDATECRLRSNMTVTYHSN